MHPVDVFVTWLYTQQLPCTHFKFDWLKATGKKIRQTIYQDTCMEMLKVLVLSDRLIIDTLTYAIVAQFSNYMDTYDICPTNALVIYAYDNLPSDNQCLQVLARAHAAWWDGREVILRDGKLQSDLPQDFLLRVVKEHGSRRTKSSQK